jgi:hypothetical protein
MVLMAKSTGIVLGAGAISFTNDWYQSKQPNWRIPIATFAVALIFAGIEKLNERAGVGLSVIMLITVLVTPMHGKAPLQTLGQIGKG